MKITFVYRHYQHDPTLHALIKWLPRVVPEVSFFRFTDEERGKAFSTSPSARLKEHVSAFGPTHIWAWNNLLNLEEASYFKSKQIKLVGLINSFVSLHAGHFATQSEYLQLLKMLDGNFIPNEPDVKTLRDLGVNCFEMPFFYDPDTYRPLPSWTHLWGMGEVPLLFVGSLTERAAQFRLRAATQIAKEIPFHAVTYLDPKVKGIHWHRPQGNAQVLNWWNNRAKLIFSMEDVGPEYEPSHLNNTVQERIVSYSSTQAFRGNRIFPAMGSGSVVLSQTSKQLLRFCTPGENILAWNTIPECIEMAQRALTNRNMWNQIAQNGNRLVREKHTAHIRISEMIRHLGVN